MVVLAALDHRYDAVYREFLVLFTKRFGDPLSCAVLLAAGFYGYAALRGISGATGAVTAALVVLAFVGPETLYSWEPDSPRPLPLLAGAVLQLALGLWRRNAWSCLIGGVGVVAAVAFTIPDEASWLRVPIAFHLGLLVVLIIGAAFDDELGRFLRVVAGGLVLLACVVVVCGGVDAPANLPPWSLEAYPVALAALLAGYGFLLRHRPLLVIAGLSAGCSLVAVCCRGYGALRQVVMGLDYIAVSLILFGLALLISLGKAGALPSWVVAWWETETPLERLDAPPPTAIQKEVPPAPPLALESVPAGEEIQQGSPSEIEKG
jgi:hypothetical protein